MEKIACSCCQKPKANLVCGICQCSICKNCAQFLDEDYFSFQPVVADELKSGVFCVYCFDGKVQPQMDKYQQDIQSAKDIIVYLKKQTKETRLVSRNEPPVKVDHCTDREETLLRLGFLAVQKGFNALIDVDIFAEKVLNGRYQTSDWKGSGIPANIDLSRIPKDRSIWSNPN